MIIALKVIFLFLTYFFIYCIASIVSENKIKINLSTIIVIILILLLNVFTFRLSNGVLKGLITFSSFAIFSKFNSKQDIKSSIVSAFIVYIIMALGETLASIFFIFIKMDDFMTHCNNLSIFKLLFSASLAFIIYLIMQIKIISKFIIKIKRNICDFKYISYVLIILFVLFETSIILLMINSSNKTEIILSVISMITIILVSLLIIYEIDKNLKLKIVNNNLLSVNESYMKVLNNYKMFKHNMKHELNAISMIGENKVKELVNEYIKEYEYKSDLNIDDLIKLPNEIKNIMYKKVVEDKNIPCNIIVDNTIEENPFDRLSMRKLNVVIQCLGIVFDNAIDASKECENGYVYIKMYKNSKGTYLDCINSFKNIIDIDDFGVQSKTTKKDHLGIGVTYLYNQKDIKITTNIRNNNIQTKVKII